MSELRLAPLCVPCVQVELYNPTSSAISLVNLVLSDDNGHGSSSRFVLGGTGCPQSLPSLTYMYFCRRNQVTVMTPTPQTVASGCSFDFGIGGGDTVNLYSDPSSTHHLIDTTPGCCADINSQAYGRMSPITAFEAMARTPGVANAPLAAPPPPAPGCYQSTSAQWAASVDLSNPSGSSFVASTTSQYLCATHVQALRVSSVLSQSATDTYFGQSTATGDIRFNVSELLTTQPYSVSPVAPARSLVESGLAGASVTCVGNTVDVSSQIASLDASLAGASCFACNVPSTTIAGVGQVQWLSAACVCGSSGCNTAALSAINTAFAWTMPQATAPTATLRPVITEVADKGNVNDALCTDADYVELYNPTSSNLALSGLTLTDDNGHGLTSRLVLGQAGCPQTLDSAQYLLLCRNGPAYTFTSANAPPVSYASCGFTFGIGGGDRVDLYLSPTDSTLLGTLASTKQLDLLCLVLQPPRADG